MRKRILPIILVIVLCLCSCGSDEEVREKDSDREYSNYKNGETVVYVTYTGECYHRRNCSYLKSRVETTLEEAIEDGYRRCSRCNPPKLTNK